MTNIYNQLISRNGAGSINSCLNKTSRTCESLNVLPVPDGDTVDQYGMTIENGAKEVSVSQLLQWVK